MGTYLVTGGCGFIGSHLVDMLLEQGHQVTIVDDLSSGKISNISLDKVSFIKGSICNKELIRKTMANVNGVFHLAAIASVQQSIQHWSETHEVNLSGAINIFDAAKDYDVPVIYASSAAIYGDNHHTPLKETEQPLPVTAYGADKLGCELHAQVAHNVFGVSTIGLRFFNVFGPRQDPNSPYSGVISVFAQKLSNGEDINIYGDGSQTRDFIYVKDVVRALLHSMKVATNYNICDVVNVCTGKETSIIKLAMIMEGVWHKSTKIHYFPERQGDIHDSLGNPEHAYELLLFLAKTDIYKAMKYMRHAFIAQNNIPAPMQNIM